MLINEGVARASAAAARAPDGERELRLRIAQSPGDVGAMMDLVRACANRGAFDEAIGWLDRITRLTPHDSAAWLLLAQLELQRGKPHAAWQTIEAMPAHVRETFDVRALEAAVLGILGRHDAEIAIYEQLVAQAPKHEGLWKSLGDALKYAGRSDEAVRAIRKAIRLRPGYGEGWWTIANLKSASFTDRDIAAMRKALAARPALDDAVHLHFALGRAFEQRADYAQSFAHYDAGNRLRAQAFAPGSMYASAVVDDMMAIFDAELMARASAGGNPSNAPIFVVGLQRSGSTLVEQILASHPEVEGTSELMVMQQLWGEVVGEAVSAGVSVRQHLLDLSAEQRSALGDRYLAGTQPFRLEGKPRFVDKLPANWMQTGFIRLILPHATIMDTRRHPMACGFSNFQQHYATGVAFAYSQHSIATFYRDYLRLMRHFAAIDPGGAHLVVNERLIEDTEGEVRRLLDFAGLSFAPECLAFHRTRRAVNTPSAEQVRRPINRDGVEHWRHYEAWLEPMKGALGDALVDWERS